MTSPKLILILSENWTLVTPKDLRSLVRIAVDAEDAGFDAVMVSEHVVLGPSSGAAGLPDNPRDYALPDNQDPRTPWPSSLLLLAAVAAATERLRLVAGAVIPPLRHPLRGTAALVRRGGPSRPAAPPAGRLRERIQPPRAADLARPRSPALGDGGGRAQHG